MKLPMVWWCDKDDDGHSVVRVECNIPGSGCVRYQCTLHGRYAPDVDLHFAIPYMTAAVEDIVFNELPNMSGRQIALRGALQ